MPAEGFGRTTDAPRVGFVTLEYPPHVGGVARSAHRIATGLAAAGFEVTVFKPLSPEEDPAAYPLVADGVAVHAFSLGLLTAVRAIRREDERRPFALFHGFTLTAAYACLQVATRGGRPVVASIRGIDGVEFDEAATAVLREAAWITSVSRASLQRALEIVDVSERSSFIANGIDTRPFRPWHATPENAGIVGTVATFRRKKNIPLLVRAYSRLPATMRRGLLLVGDFYDADAYDVAMRDETCRALLETGITEEVELTGYVDHSCLPDHHERMNVFALSSDNEGLPNAVLEAAASGVPIVATAVDGVKDIFFHGRDALLVEPGRCELLSAALREVLADENLATALSRGARSTAARFTVAAERQQYVDLYRRLLGAVAKPRPVPMSHMEMP